MDGEAAPQSGTQPQAQPTSPTAPPADLWSTRTDDIRGDRKARAAKAMEGRKPNPRAAAPAPKTDGALAAPTTSTSQAQAAPAPAHKQESTAGASDVPAAGAPEKVKTPEPRAATPAPAPTAAEPEDERTKRGLAAIERREAQFRAEQTRIKEEHDRREARIVQRENEVEGKTASVAQLKGLRPAQLVGELRKLGYASADFDAFSRVAWSQTEAGAKDPKALDAAREAEAHYAASKHDDELATVRRELDELKGEVTKQQQLATQRETGMRWIETAVKAIPTDKPTLLGRLHAKSPDRARAALVHIGAELERATGETPTHDEVFAEFEKRQRAGLEESGVDVDAMLKLAPAQPTSATTTTTTTTQAAQPKTPSRTLDVSQPATGTRPREPKTKPMTRQERITHARELREQELRAR